jgi:hypothetical protein
MMGDEADNVFLLCYSSRISAYGQNRWWLSTTWSAAMVLLVSCFRIIEGNKFCQVAGKIFGVEAFL